MRRVNAEMRVRDWGAYLAIGIGCWALSADATADAQTRKAIDADVQQTLQRFNNLDARHVGLESHAVGMLIFPQVTKGGIALAAEYGEGVLRVNGVTTGYYSLASASVGLTAGMATRSEIILFMTQEALDHFMKSPNWSIGAGTGIALISKGGGRDYDSSMLKKPVLGFIFGETGLMADLSLEGSKIKKIDK